MSVQPRELLFFAANGWLILCPLICEDLARQDPVAPVIRTVGPSLVIALLLDGPQLGVRWPARYAAVLADDPGSSVLTVTPIGMVDRSRVVGAPPSRVVALWQDARTRQRREISLDPNAQGILLTLCASWSTEWTADGRDDGNRTAQLVLSSIEQVIIPPRDSS